MDYGCKHGLPHDLKLVHDGPSAMWEVCSICSRKFRWTKGARGRVNNPQYLKAHARNYAQPTGPTRRLYKRLYDPESCIIKI